MSLMDSFRPKWKHSKESVRLAAVNDLTDQKVLAEVAKTDISSEVCEAAVRNLTDEWLLAEVAGTPSTSVGKSRLMALEKISSEDVLESAFNRAAQHVGKEALMRSLLLKGEALSLMVCHAVVRRHTEQGFLARVVDGLHVPLSELRACAVQKLTDQALLVKIAETHREAPVRVAAVEKLADHHQPVFTSLALEDKDWTVRAAAVERLTNKWDLARIAQKKDYANEYGEFSWERLQGNSVEEVRPVRAAAVRKLTDQALLAKIATTDRSSEVRAAAVESLTDQAALAKVAQSDEEPTVGKAAVEKLTDQAALAEIAYGRASNEAQEAAVRKLTDQTLLAKIAESTVSYVHVRVAVVRKLSDQRVLAELARTAAHDEVRVAAAEKLTELTEDNFTRWKYSSEPQVWVSAHLEGWNHGDWVQLLAVLRNSQYWPMEEAAIGRHLEMLRKQALTESQPSLLPPPAPELPGVDMDRVERECIPLLISARAWGEARGFDATWMEHSPPYQQLRDLGKSVSDAAGLQGLATVILAVRRSYRYGYLLDHFWDGIGEWRA